MVYHTNIDIVSNSFFDNLISFHFWITNKKMLSLLNLKISMEDLYCFEHTCNKKSTTLMDNKFTVLLRWQYYILMLFNGFNGYSPTHSIFLQLHLVILTSYIVQGLMNLNIYNLENLLVKICYQIKPGN